MFGPHFYNERVRKSVAVFGSLFNNLYIIRRSGNTVLSQMKVPLTYAPKEKFMERISEMNNGEETERQVAIKLPRMSFEIVNMAYDASRQLPKNNYYKRVSEEDGDKQQKYYVSTPYIISFQLNVYAKSHDDALQVVEQIIPYFAPQYTVSVKPYTDRDDIIEDVPLILNSVTFTDDYEGALEQRRSIIYTLEFDMKVGFHGPKPQDSGVIQRVDADLFNFDNPQSIDNYLETVVTTTDPSPVSADSDYTILTDVRDSDASKTLPNPFR